MGLKVGAADVADVKLGVTQVAKVMLGAEQVWPTSTWTWYQYINQHGGHPPDGYISSLSADRVTVPLLDGNGRQFTFKTEFATDLHKYVVFIVEGDEQAEQPYELYNELTVKLATLSNWLRTKPEGVTVYMQINDTPTWEGPLPP